MEQLICASLSHNHYWFDRYIEELLNEGARIQRKPKDEDEIKPRKNITPQKGNTSQAKEKKERKETKTAGGYKFAPPVANQLWRANQHEHACSGLSSP